VVVARVCGGSIQDLHGPAACPPGQAACFLAPPGIDEVLAGLYGIVEKSMMALMGMMDGSVGYRDGRLTVQN